MSSLSWSVILLINEVFVQLRFSGEKKKNHEKRNWSTSNHVHISSVKFHSSHDKGTRKQFLSRIILAQNPCHIVIKAFHSILAIAMCRCTIITLLLDFNFQFSFPCSFTEEIFTLCTDSMSFVLWVYFTIFFARFIEIVNLTLIFYRNSVFYGGFFLECFTRIIFTF